MRRKIFNAFGNVLVGEFRQLLPTLNFAQGSGTMECLHRYQEVCAQLDLFRLRDCCSVSPLSVVQGLDMSLDNVCAPEA